MKTIIIAASFMFLFMGFDVAQTVNTATNTGIIYACSMHPEIISDTPGTCPRCGMDLIQKAIPQYTCPMHAEVVSDSPGKCPKCKMDLVVKTSAIYSCAMHPEVTSVETGKCPKCGMKLKQTKSTDPKMKMGCCM